MNFNKFQSGKLGSKSKRARVVKSAKPTHSKPSIPVKRMLDAHRLEREWDANPPEAPIVPIVEVQGFNALPLDRFYLGYVGDKEGAMYAYYNHFGCWPKRMIHWVDESNGAHEWRMLPRKCEDLRTKVPIVVTKLARS